MKSSPANNTREYIIPETEGIKYAGSKLRLLPHIIHVLQDLPDIRCVLDGFSGTTRVAQAFAQLGYDTSANDISVWSETFGRCYLLADRPDAWYCDIIDHLNHLEGVDGWFTEHYGGDIHEAKKPFQAKNTRKLDAIRDEIDRLGLDTNDKAVLLTSLILAMDKCDSTIGHFASYLSRWSSRSYRELELQVPRKFPIVSKNQVFRGDIFELIRSQSFDFAYLDPPYGSNNEKMPPSRVRYNAYYHFWKTVILNDRPTLFGKAGRRADSRDTVDPSVFESYQKNSEQKYCAMAAIDQLISEISARYILLSYSSGGRATREELMDILQSHGLLKKVFEIDYQKNVMAGMTSTNEWLSDNQQNREYLFLLEK